MPIPPVALMPELVGFRSLPFLGHGLLGRNLAAVVRVVVTLVPVVFPLQRLQVAQFVGPTLRHRLDVVDFPAPLLRLSVLGPLHARVAGVLAETRIRGLWFSLLPNSLNRPLIEAATARRRVWVSCHNSSSPLFRPASPAMYAEYALFADLSTQSRKKRGVLNALRESAR